VCARAMSSHATSGRRPLPLRTVSPEKRGQEQPHSRSPRGRQTDSPPSPPPKTLKRRAMGRLLSLLWWMFHLTMVEGGGYYGGRVPRVFCGASAHAC
jgi:hypothetical protein